MIQINCGNPFWVKLAKKVKIKKVLEIHDGITRKLTADADPTLVKILANERSN